MAVDGYGELYAPKKWRTSGTGAIALTVAPGANARLIMVTAHFDAAPVTIERHLHSSEWWFEAAAVPNGEVHVADRIGNGNGLLFRHTRVRGLIWHMLQQQN